MKVSVLLITYNHEKYIRNAIDGILIQKDCPDYEVIISDDCSKDATLNLAKEKFSNFPNLTISSNTTNLGITKNYQKGFSLCKGEYIFVLEGDDYWIDPYKIKRQVEFLEQNPFCVMCFHPFIYEKDDLRIFTNNFKNTNNSASDLFDIRDLILDEGLIANFSVCCYRKLVLVKLPMEIFEIVTYDWMVNISMAQFGFLARINIPMSVYRLSSTGVWSNMEEKERTNKTIKLISEYDRALNYRYSNLFNDKIQSLTNQLTPEKSLKRVSWRAFLPPILILLIKFICPPILLSFLRKS